MTLFHLHYDDAQSTVRENRYSVWRVFRGIAAALGTLHRSIVSAKLRHGESAMLLWEDYKEMLPAKGEQDTAKFPLRPLILGDKWDF